jgi:uncharacterized protein with FMN-binding domain
VLYALYDLNATFGISGISIAAGSASSEANGDASSAIRYAKVSAQSTNLDVNAVYVNGTINNGTAFFSITFIATTVS